MIILIKTTTTKKKIRRIKQKANEHEINETVFQSHCENHESRKL